MEAVAPTFRASPRHHPSGSARTAVVALVALGAVAIAPASEAAPGRPGEAKPAAAGAFVCTLPRGAASLPVSARRGLIGHLHQYPEVALASPRQRAVARQLLDELRVTARRWSSPRAARAAGFDTRTVARARADRRAHYLHAEWRHERAGARLLDVRRPKALIYANEPGRPLVLVGVMYSMRRDERGPSPGGPITRWHAHAVCSLRGKRGTKPHADGSCPGGARRIQGSEMMHVWFTSDLRSAFAVRAPEPELCREGLLTGPTCRSPGFSGGM